METMDECPVCKTLSVIYDEENGQKVRVCTECGAMDADMQDLVSEIPSEGSTLTDGKTRGPDALKHRSYFDKDCKGLTLGRKLIRLLGPSFHLNKSMIEESVKLYERVFEEDVKFAKEDKRRAMCVACLYITARLNNQGMLIKNLGKYLDIPKPYKRFGQAFSILRNKYGIELPPNSLASDTYHLLSEKSFEHGEIRLVQQLIPLLQRSWISEGRSPKPLICVASYYVWKAKDYINRRKVSYAKFCKKFELTLYKGRKREIELLLQAMAKELPWVVADPNEDIDVTTHLVDIIKYQNLLFDSAIKTTIENLKLTREDNDSDGGDGGIKTIEEKESIFRICEYAKAPKRDEAEEERLLNEIKSFPKKRKYEHEDHSVRNDDDDDFGLGSDDDTSQHIRTEKEVEELKAFYAQFENV